MGIYYDKLVRELKKTSFSPRTHESYIRETRRFFFRKNAKVPLKTAEDDVTDWLLELKAKNYAPSSINMAKCGLQFFFTRVLGHTQWTVFKDFKCGKANGRRPSLSVREVWKILSKVRTLHNRTALTIIYLCGLRISECLALQCGDIHRDEGMLHVHRGKGAKSRCVPLPKVGLELLTQHWRAHGNRVMLFPAMGRGMNKNVIKTTLEPMPISSLQNVFKEASKEAGVNKRGLSVHCLRHSYATHLLELGVPIEHLKTLMGHKYLSTTEMYLHITKDGFAQTKMKIEKLAEGNHVKT